MIGHDLEDGVQVHHAEILEDLANGFAGALELAKDFFVLEVVNEALLFDEREEWI